MAVRKVPFTIERTFRSSPTILYEFLTSTACLVQWFCDHVDLTGELYTFSWNGDEQQAEVLSFDEDVFVRLRWLDDEDDKAYFEYRIKKNDITGETILYITDFAYKEEIQESAQLWDSQLKDLKVCIGG
jgi:uncharacterized protein YndB with AHSA1/START domain